MALWGSNKLLIYVVFIVGEWHCIIMTGVTEQVARLLYVSQPKQTTVSVSEKQPFVKAE